MSVFKVFAHILRNAKKIVKRHNHFTKLPIITIGVFPIKVEYRTLKEVYTTLIRWHNCKCLQT